MAKKRRLVLITWNDPFEVVGTWVTPDDIVGVGPHKTAGWLLPNSEHNLPVGWIAIAGTVTSEGLLGDVTCIPESLIVSTQRLD